MILILFLNKLNFIFHNITISSFKVEENNYKFSSLILYYLKSSYIIKKIGKVAVILCFYFYFYFF